jgi:exodeoxyribonuclease-1
MKNQSTFLWHDYETFGAHPKLDRPAQFAALRTDMDLQPVADPISWFCQPATDVFPHPVASLITGITPQDALRDGMTEAGFASKIRAEMLEPDTCSAGYNSIRFDDEFSRNLFYRNLYDPYEREYKNGNKRWDLINLARMCYALRPEGIKWPEHEAGKPSFKLEDLSSTNGISHEGAHEALSDVLATIGLARLIRTCQPRLFDWALGLRNQKSVMGLLNTVNPVPILHTSSRIPATRGCTTLVLPICIYPDRAKSVIVFDLMGDPQALIECSAEQISDRVFTPAVDLPEGVERISLKAIHSNQVPMLAPASTLRGVDCERIGLDSELCELNAQKLSPVLAQVRNKVMEVFKPYIATPDSDPDHGIYSGGFFSNSDRALMNKIHNMRPRQWTESHWPFKDPRLKEMLFRYRARNFPDALSASESERWEADRLHRLNLPSDPRQLNPATFVIEIAVAREQHQGDPRAQKILDQLQAWGNDLIGRSLTDPV